MNSKKNLRLEPETITNLDNFAEILNLSIINFPFDYVTLFNLDLINYNENLSRENVNRGLLSTQSNFGLLNLSFGGIQDLKNTSGVEESEALIEEASDDDEFELKKTYKGLEKKKPSFKEICDAITDLNTYEQIVLESDNFNLAKLKITEFLDKNSSNKQFN